MRHATDFRAAMVALPLLATLGGCSGWHADTDERRINTLLLQVLTSDGKGICVDSGTYGEPLAIFRAMLPAPEPARRPLAWSKPAPLTPGRNLTGQELVGSELKGQQVVLPERPSGKDRLSVIEQIQLNDWARQASFASTYPAVSLADTPEAPRARVRWWGWNRLDSSCRPIYTVSKPVIFQNMAFVSVTAAHQGSTYAFRKAGAAWAPHAKWSNWLY